MALRRRVSGTADKTRRLNLVLQSPADGMARLPLVIRSSLLSHLFVHGSDGTRVTAPGPVFCPFVTPWLPRTKAKPPSLICHSSRHRQCLFFPGFPGELWHTGYLLVSAPPSGFNLKGNPMLYCADWVRPPATAKSSAGVATRLLRKTLRQQTQTNPEALYCTGVVKQRANCRPVANLLLGPQTCYDVTSFSCPPV